MAELLVEAPLSGRVAVVTGASSGIGEATGERLAQLGASVAVLARREDRLNALTERVAAFGGRAMPINVDVRHRDEVLAAAEAIEAELGMVDLVVNNAGVQHVSPIEDLRTDDWQHQIDLNVTGVTNVLGAFIRPLIAAAAAGRPADLITTSSIAATRQLEKFQVYSGTKAYISQITRVLRLELAAKHVRVSAIQPGMVDTELPNHVDDPDATSLMANLIRDINVLQSSDVAETIAFVAAQPRHINLSEITILPTAQAI